MEEIKDISLNIMPKVNEVMLAIETVNKSADALGLVVDWSTGDVHKKQTL